MKFPKTVYIYIDVDGNNAFLIANEASSGASPGVGEKRKIGVYELVETATVICDTVVVDRRPAK